MNTTPASTDLRHRHGTRRRRAWIWAGRAGALLALLLVFAAWHQPDMLMQTAQQLWSCFG